MLTSIVHPLQRDGGFVFYRPGVKPARDGAVHQRWRSAEGGSAQESPGVLGVLLGVLWRFRAREPQDQATAQPFKPLSAYACSCEIPPVMDSRREAVLAYHHRAVRLPRVGRVAGALARHIGAAASLLDIGCDDGRVAREVGARVGARRIVGVDLTVRADVEIEAVPYDGEVLPFEDGAFEAVTVSDVLHHCADPERLLRESLRVAARVVAVKDHFRFGPVSDKILHLMDTIGNAQPGIHVRGRYFYPAEWIALVRAAGGRITGLEWPLQIHDYPWRLVTQDRLQFASRVERAAEP